MLAQTSVSQATLQYTAAAFAATHHEYESRRRSSTKRLDMTGQDSAVTMLYIDAVSKARQALAEASSTAEAVRTGFIMSFMLAATESLMNSTEGVTMHLTNGLKIAFSQGYETIKSSRKPCKPGLALKDSVLAFIQRLKVTTEKELDMTPQGHRGTDKSTCNPCTEPYTNERLRHPLCNIYLDICGLVDHLVIWLAETSAHIAGAGASIHSETLETFSQGLRHLSLKASKTERRKLRFVRLYQEAAHLLLLCHMNDLTVTDNTDISRSPTNSESNYLRAYFSKLGIIEEQLRREETVVTHLTPAQLKRFAARYSLICPPSPSHPLCFTQDATSLQTLYREVEQLVILEKDAIMATGLVPADVTCMEVTSALEQGSVSIRYCIVRSGGTSFEWVEKKALLWKPAVFKQHRIY